MNEGAGPGRHLRPGLVAGTSPRKGSKAGSNASATALALYYDTVNVTGACARGSEERVAAVVLARTRVGELVVGLGIWFESGEQPLPPCGRWQQSAMTTAKLQCGTCPTVRSWLTKVLGGSAQSLVR